MNAFLSVCKSKSCMNFEKKEGKDENMYKLNSAQAMNSVWASIPAFYSERKRKKIESRNEHFPVFAEMHECKACVVPTTIY